MGSFSIAKTQYGKWQSNYLHTPISSIGVPLCIAKALDLHGDNCSPRPSAQVPPWQPPLFFPRARSAWTAPSPPASDRACPWRPYNLAYVRGRWRGHFDFHGGGILEWGSHTVDLCQWAALKDDTAPIEYVPEGDGVVCTYDDGLKLVMRTDGWMGLGTCSVRYEGDEGWIETGDSGQFAIYPESLRTERTVFARRGTDPTTHIRNFLDCVKTRKPANANSDVAAQSHIACHEPPTSPGNSAAHWKFDPVKDEFLGDEEANRMRSRAMREPWRI